MRRGVSLIYGQRLFQANNCHLPNYDASKLSTYTLMLNANNLYGGVMQNDLLTWKDYTLDAHNTLDEILKVSSTAQHGFIVEVDIDYPPKIHEAHQN